MTLKRLLARSMVGVSGGGDVRRATGDTASSRVQVPAAMALIRRLGQGGEAEALLCWDRRLQRQVLLKRLCGRPQKPASDGFLQEKRYQPADLSRVYSQLGGVCAPMLYDVVVEHGQQWLSLEYIDGLPLACAETGAGIALAPLQCLSVVLDVMDALTLIHERGWVHGDVSPCNIVLTHSGKARLIDFDLAQRQGESCHGAGVEGFRAPLINGLATAHPADDGFSVGALILWLLGIELPRSSADSGSENGSGFTDAACAVTQSLMQTAWSLTRDKREDRCSIAVARQWLTSGLQNHRANLRESLALIVARASGETRVLASSSPSLEEGGQPVGIVEGASKEQPAIGTARRFILRPLTAEGGRAATYCRSVGVFAFASLAIVLLVRPLWSNDASTSPIPIPLVAALSVSPETPLPADFNADWLGATFLQSSQHRLADSVYINGGARLELLCDASSCDLTVAHQDQQWSHEHWVNLRASSDTQDWVNAVAQLAADAAH